MSAPLPPPVQQVAVVVPARNEQQLLPGCLAALAAAAERVTVPVTVLVVLDRCTDGTAETAGRAPRRPVGREPRRLCRGGARHRRRPAPSRTPARRRAGRGSPARTPTRRSRRPGWPTTSTSPTVAPTSSSARSTCPRPTATGDHVGGWRAAYRRLLGPGGGHPHVHGANLGVRGSTYLAAGGFLPVPAHEDRLLARAVAELPRCARRHHHGPPGADQRPPGVPGTARRRRRPAGPRRAVPEHEGRPGRVSGPADDRAGAAGVDTSGCAAQCRRTAAEQQVGDRAHRLDDGAQDPERPWAHAPAPRVAGRGRPGPVSSGPARRRPRRRPPCAARP